MNKLALDSGQGAAVYICGHPLKIVQGLWFWVFRCGRRVVYCSGFFLLAGSLGRLGFMTLFCVPIDTFKLPISEAKICIALLFS